MNTQKTEYNKSAQSLVCLAQELSIRFNSGDKEEIRTFLETIGYYRLKGYWYKFRSSTEYVALSGEIKKQKILADFQDIKNIYNFDRALRFVLLDAIERIEVAVRAMTVHESAKSFGLFGYLEPSNYCTSYLNAESFTERIKGQIDRAKNSNLAIRSFYGRHTNPFPPICISSEVFDFGTTVQLFRYSPKSSRRNVAGKCGGFDHKVILSWLTVLNDVRNACAHHNRVWDRQWAKVPLIPKAWKSELPFEDIFPARGTGIILAVCNALLKAVAPECQWKNRLFALFSEARFSKIPLSDLGLPENWKEHRLWCKSEK